MATPRKIKCLVERLIDHGDHVFTVDLKPESRMPRFAPGQFLHLALDAYDPTSFWPESRVFSIASSTQDRERLRISYSVQGSFTKRMEAELCEGREVWTKLPYGDFVVRDDADVVLFAGGTGMTAYTSFIESLNSDFGRDVLLAYGARYDRLLIYKDSVLSRAAELPCLMARFFVEEGVVASDCDNEGVSFEKGRLCVDSIWPELTDPHAKAYYISGPPAMISSLKKQLHDKGIDAASIHIDAWE